MGRRLNWGTIAALTIAVASAIAAPVAFSLRPRAQGGAERAAPPLPDDRPLDFSDWRVRHAMAAYANTLQDGLVSIDYGCAAGTGSGEIYRVALASNADIAVVDLTVAGGRAFVDVKKIGRGEPAEWRTVSKRNVAPNEIEAVRERAARLLTSNIAPAVGDLYIDSSELTIQMCRRGRYHFFQRHNPQLDETANAPFIAFVDTMLALRRGTDPGS